MTKNHKAIEIVNVLADHLLFQKVPDGEMPKLKNCKWNDILLNNIVRVGEIDKSDTDDLCMVVIAAYFGHKFQAF